jgi:hypothetical protein
MHLGGDLPLPTEEGFHPAIWSSETHSTHPALIVPCLDEDSRPVRMQAVLLDPSTGAKAATAFPQRAFGAGYGAFALERLAEYKLIACPIGYGRASLLRPVGQSHQTSRVKRAV